MGYPENATNFGALTAATAVAILTAAIVPHFPVRSPPIFDDMIAWLLVLAIIGNPMASYARIWKIRAISTTTPLSNLYWIAAVSMTFNAVLAAYFDTLWIYPTAACALLARRPNWLLRRLEALLVEYIPYKLFYFATGIASFVSLVPLFDPTLDAARIGAAILAGFGLIGMFSSLTQLSGQDEEFLDGWRDLGTPEVVRGLQPRVHFLFCIVSVSIATIWRELELDWINAAVASILKAAHWTSIFWITQETPWEIALAISAYVAASVGSSYPTGPGLWGMFQTFSRATISVLSLYQIVDFLPKSEKGRVLLAVFALWPTSSLVRHVFLCEHRILWPGSNGPQYPDPNPY